jgi:hypothetical protein
MISPRADAGIYKSGPAMLYLSVAFMDMPKYVKLRLPVSDNFQKIGAAGSIAFFRFIKDSFRRAVCY